MPAKLQYKAAQRRGSSFASPGKRIAQPSHDAPAVERVAHSLLKSRRWCLYEWLYSPVDLGFFSHNAFQEMLNEHGLAEVSHLTRAEWSRVRWHFGRSRRFSKQFVAEERRKLQLYRQLVRLKQSNQPTDGIPQADTLPVKDVPAVLMPGERVYAAHPAVFHSHLGVVSSYDTSCHMYNVVFDDQHLGECWVEDIYVMRCLSSSSNKRKPSAPRKLPNHGPSNAFPASHPVLTPPRPLQYATPVSPTALVASKGPGTTLIGSMPSDMMRDVEFENLAALDAFCRSKGSVLAHLHELNLQAQEFQQKNMPCPLSFQESYAHGIVQLRSLNEAIRSRINLLHSQIRKHPQAPPSAPNLDMLGLEAHYKQRRAVLPSPQLFLQSSRAIISKCEMSLQPTKGKGYALDETLGLVAECLALLQAVKSGTAKRDVEFQDVEHALDAALGRVVSKAQHTSCRELLGQVAMLHNEIKGLVERTK